ncbi:23S rRNA (guanosine(2251)-2'-O)-methyltransferase RlmB [Treponema phagedenis]|uniref:23S rRNA (guanosine(2251)-2'-O)-methyltransferase RlmB n=1 Tax=Treponema phagedenis TaxID=162 RepID=UPI0001F6426B|nr:23S rRNA (guanosine(2251)-2'-O)-methyltransferase RlmB [Treponema phagedenis]EFW39193.1 RNA methyltransferase, TrmH family, group 3 [Treponema phagedenis F0421]
MIIISGFHSIEERLRASTAEERSGITLYYAKSGPRVKKIIAQAGQLGVQCIQSTDAQLDSMASSLPESLRAHRGVLLTAEKKESAKGSVSSISIEEIFAAVRKKESALILMADSITDPHNIGAIVRSADQFGVDAVIVPQRHSAGDSEIIAKISAGATAWVPLIEVPNLVRTAEQCKKEGFWVYGADASGEPIGKLSFPQKTLLILGSEGSGIARLLKNCCDSLIAIPTRGKLDSLNVSVAAGILLYEIRRSLGV